MSLYAEHVTKKQLQPCKIMFEKKITFDSFIRTLVSIGIIIGVLVLIDHLSGVLLPFFLAWLISYLIYPTVKFFQFKVRLKNRALSIFCTLTLLTVIITTLFSLLIPPIIQEFSKVQDLLFIYLGNGMQDNGASIPQILSQFLQNNVDIEALTEFFNEENLMNTLKSSLPKLWLILSESISILASIFASFIILLYIVFILLDYEAISQGWSRLIPVKYRKFAENLAADVEHGMNKYFRGQALVALLVGILFSVGFLIIDFPLAIGLGLFIGMLNMVPYLQIIGIVPTILLAMLKAADTGQNFWIIMALAITVFAVVQILQDVFIVPKIMGKITGLNPAIILLSLSVWGSLMGMLGMIIALPLTTLMISYYKRFILDPEKANSEDLQIADNQPKEDTNEK